MHGQRVHDAAVVARNDEKIVKADPVFRPLAAFIREQLALRIGIQLRHEQDTFLAEIGDRRFRRERVFRFRRFVFPGVTERGARNDFLAFIPAVANKIIRDAAGNVFPVVPDIDLSVANSLWGREGVPFKEKFLQVNDEFYGGELRTLDFGSNQFDEDLPQSIGNLTKLEQFWFNNCRITGPLPAGLGNLTELRALNGGANRMSGEIPAGLENLTKLERLSLELNRFTGFNSGLSFAQQ